MPSDFTALQASIDALAAQAAKTVGTEASAAVVLQGFATAITKAVTDALTADAAANAGSITAATNAITATTKQFLDADDALGAAVAANPGTPPPPANGPPGA